MEAEQEISLSEILEVFKKNWRMIAGFTVSALLFGFLINQFVLEPVYTAESRLYILNTQQGAGGYGQDGGIVVDSAALSSSLMLSKDYVEILKSNRVTQSATERMHLPDLKAYDISISTASDTRMIKIVVNGTEQKGVAKLANILTEEFTACVQDIMHMDNVTVIDTASVPITPSGPAKIRNSLLAALAGMIFAIAIAFLRFYLDTTIKSSEDVERYLALPVLSKVPDFSR